MLDSGKSEALIRLLTNYLESLYRQISTQLPPATPYGLAYSRGTSEVLCTVRACRCNAGVQGRDEWVRGPSMIRAWPLEYI